MSREILFRGKRTDTGEWVEGYFGIKDGYSNEKIYCIMKPTFDIRMEYSYFTDYEVIPESVSEFIGLTDKNGKRIFEGDIVQAEISGGAYDKFVFPVGIIVFENCSFCIKDSKAVTPLASYSSRVTFEIIGNIHDNPELLN